MTGVALRGWGDFGQALTGHLEARLDGAEVQPPSSAPWEGLLIAAFSREEWRLADALDEAAHSHGAPWIPVVFGTSDLRCGPHVLPGTTPCWRCTAGFGADATADDVHEALLRQSATGPAGYLPLHLTMAEQLLRSALATAPPRVLSIDLSSASLSSSPYAIGYDGCSRCANHREPVTALPRLDIEMAL